MTSQAASQLPVSTGETRFFADGSINMFESTSSFKREHFTSNEIQARFLMYNLFNIHFHILSSRNLKKVHVNTFCIYPIHYTINNK